MNTLLEPLDGPQQLLLETVWKPFLDGKKFPVFAYVEYVMRLAGHDAAVVLNGFPRIGTHLREQGYGAVGWHAQGSWIPAKAQVWPTIAGLHHINHSIASAAAEDLLAFMRALTKQQQRILESPFQVLNLHMDLAEAVRQSSIDRNLTFLAWAAPVAEHEWPGLSFNQRAGTSTGNGTLGFLDAADFQDTNEYLVTIEAVLARPEPLATLTYGEPRALLRAANFLDITYELVTGGRLVERPPVDRSSLLALSVSSEADFHTGVAVLAELLNRLKVPGKNPSHPLGRIEQHLADTMPGIDQDAVRDAVHTLDQIRVLRNSAIHTKPAPELLEAHKDLGLTFPINDFATAWDSLRAHAEQAFGTLQEAIQATRP
ncbi:hypothetical protein ACFYNO_32600 [Kitasatospora sp. NPDC006697]|uniref:hypothetical protein n=1 Tax=Kitasatospora sp. NPDC006697 TaxID=3364020 RepID=UPI0036855794